MAIIFGPDSFNRTAGTDLGANWTERAGNWEITTGEKLNLASGAANACAHSSSVMSTADYTVEAEVNASSWTFDYEGVIGRRVDYSTSDNNGYIAMAISPTDFRLYKRVSGSFTSLGNYTVVLVSNIAAIMKVSMQGTTIKAYIGAVEAISVTDSALSSAGNCGVFCGGTANLNKFDDVVAEDFGGSGTVIPIFMNQYRQRWGK